MLASPALGRSDRNSTSFGRPGPPIATGTGAYTVESFLNSFVIYKRVRILLQTGLVWTPTEGGFLKIVTKALVSVNWNTLINYYKRLAGRCRPEDLPVCAVAFFWDMYRLICHQWWYVVDQGWELYCKDRSNWACRLMHLSHWSSKSRSRWLISRGRSTDRNPMVSWLLTYYWRVRRTFTKN